MTRQIPTRAYRIRCAPLLWLTLPFAAGIGCGYTFADKLAVTPLLCGALLLAMLAAVIAFRRNEPEQAVAAEWHRDGGAEDGRGNGGPEEDHGGERMETDREGCAKDYHSSGAAHSELPSQKLWALLFVCAAFLCGAAYALLREPPAGPFIEVPREAVLTLEVQRVFAANRADGFVSGIGSVVDAPDYLPDMQGQRVAFSVWTKAGFSRDHPPLLRTGQIIIKGRLTDFDAPPPPSLKDSGADGFRNFLRSQGVRYQIDSGSILTVSDAGSTWRQLCERIKERMHNALQSGANTEATHRLASIGIAMLLGDTSLLPVDDRSAFTISGTMHLFAVSGLHVVLIATAFAAAGELLGFSRARVAVAGIALLWVYVQVVGAPPSATRAWWMSSLFWAAIALRRQHSPLSALCASMLIILFINPRDFLSVGFQLSYSVVAGILLYALPLASALENWALHRLDNAHSQLRRYPRIPPRLWYALPERQRRSLLSLFTISLVGTLYSTPLVLGLFGNFAPGGLLVNLLLVPVSFWVLCALLLACAFGLVSLLPLASLFNHAAWLLLAAMAWVASLSLASPFGFYTGLAWRWPYYSAAATIVLIAASFATHARCLQNRPLWQYSLIPLLWFALLAIGLLP